MKKEKSLLASISYQEDVKKDTGKILNIYEIGKNISRRKIYKKITFCARVPIDKSK